MTHKILNALLAMAIMGMCIAGFLAYQKSYETIKCIQNQCAYWDDNLKRWCFFELEKERRMKHETCKIDGFGNVTCRIDDPVLTGSK